MKKEYGKKWAIPLMTAVIVTAGITSCGKTNTEELKTTEAISTVETSSGAQSETESTAEEASKEEMTTLHREIDIQYFEDKSISITYPILKNIGTPEIEAKVNEQLKQDALRVLEFYNVNAESDTMNIMSEISGIEEEWISVIYTGEYMSQGAAHPELIFYSSNINLTTGEHIQINEIMSISELIELIAKSKSYEIIMMEENEALEKDLKKFIEELGEEEWKVLLEKADFGNSSYDSYPECFTYRQQEKGDIVHLYIAIPVPYALGNYAILKILP